MDMQSIKQMDQLNINLTKNRESISLMYQDEKNGEREQKIKKCYDSLKVIRNNLSDTFIKIEEFSSEIPNAKREYIYLDEMLLQSMIQIDDINGEGDEEVRAAKRKVLLEIKQYSALLDKKKSTDLDEESFFNPRDYAFTKSNDDAPQYSTTYFADEETIRLNDLELPDFDADYYQNYKASEISGDRQSQSSDILKIEVSDDICDNSQNANASEGDNPEKNSFKDSIITPDINAFNEKNNKQEDKSTDLVIDDQPNYIDKQNSAVSNENVQNKETGDESISSGTLALKKVFEPTDSSEILGNKNSFNSKIASNAHEFSDKNINSQNKNVEEKQTKEIIHMKNEQNKMMSTGNDKDIKLDWESKANGITTQEVASAFVDEIKQPKNNENKIIAEPSTKMIRNPIVSEAKNKLNKKMNEKNDEDKAYNKYLENQKKINEEFKKIEEARVIIKSTVIIRHDDNYSKLTNIFETSIDTLLKLNQVKNLERLKTRLSNDSIRYSNQREDIESLVIKIQHYFKEMDIYIKLYSNSETNGSNSFEKDDSIMSNIKAKTNIYENLSKK